MRKQKLIIICLSMLFVATGFSENTKLKIAYTDWYPYTYQEDNKAMGFEIEILRSVMEMMNMQVEFINYPFNRCLMNLEFGSVDALVSLLKTPEREQYAYFPEEYISISKTVLFTLQNKQFNFTGSYDQLRKYRIGVIAGFSYGKAFDDADYLQKDSAKDAPMLIEKLLNGRHDIAVGNQAVISAYAQQMNAKEDIAFLAPPIHTEKLYVGFAKANNLENLCSEFSRSLAQFKQSAEYKDILKKYGIASEY